MKTHVRGDDGQLELFETAFSVAWVSLPYALHAEAEQRVPGVDLNKVSINLWSDRG